MFSFKWESGGGDDFASGEWKRIGRDNIPFLGDDTVALAFPELLLLLGEGVILIVSTTDRGD